MKTGKRVRISADGRIVIPKQLRRGTGIREGNDVIVTQMSYGALLVYKPHDSVLDKMLEPLRKEAMRQGFTADELVELIKKIRREKREASLRGEAENQ